MPKSKKEKSKEKEPELCDRELSIHHMHINVHIKSENNTDTLEKMKEIAYEILDKYING